MTDTRRIARMCSVYAACLAVWTPRVASAATVDEAVRASASPRLRADLDNADGRTGPPVDPWDQAEGDDELTMETESLDEASANAPVELASSGGGAAAVPTATPTARVPRARGRSRLRTSIAPVPEDHPRDAPQWHLGGFVDTVYAVSSSRPDNHLNRGTATQPRLDEFSVNHVAMYVRHLPRDGAWDWSMELAAHAGPATAALVANEPIAGGVAGAFAGPSVWQHLGRANVGFRAPNGAELTAGLHASPIGLGVHWTVYNWNVTTSWELNSVPYYLPGLRYRQPLDKRGRHALEAWIVNGWQIAAENNAAPSGVLAYVFAPSRELTVSQYTWFGPESPSIAPQAWRLLSNTQFMWNRDAWGLAGLFDVGGDGRDAGAQGQRYSTWITGSIKSRWRVLQRPSLRWDMAARAEAFWDGAGRMYSVPETTFVAGTFTQQLRVVNHLLLRLEYRYDHALGPDGYFFYRGAVTPGSSGLAHNQHLLLLSIAAQFDLAFGR